MDYRNPPPVARRAAHAIRRAVSASGCFVANLTDRLAAGCNAHDAFEPATPPAPPVQPPVPANPNQADCGRIRIAAGDV